MRKVIFIALVTTITILGIHFAGQLQSHPELAVLIAFVLAILVMVGVWVLASNF